jgi:uncharacterized protein YndB with AHSA1/START domain
VTDRVRRQCELTAPPEIVWRALTDPEWLSQWLADSVEIDLVPGGEARFVVEGQTRSGWVEEVCPPTDDGIGHISFWWQGDEEAASRVCLEIEPGAEGTRLRVTEARPLEILDLVGIPLHDESVSGGGSSGPALVAA